MPQQQEFPLTSPLPERVAHWGPLLPPPKPSRYKPSGLQEVDRQSADPLRNENWLRETEAFFAFQSTFFLEHQTDVPALHAMLADMKDRLVVLECKVQKFDVFRSMPLQERTEAWLLEWEALDTGMTALDAICWGFPWVKPVHGEYKNYGELRALAHDRNPFERHLSERGGRAWDYTSLTPPHITNAYRILLVERNRLDNRYEILISEGCLPPAVPAKFFFALAKQLGISTELQVEMATVEKPAGGSFFVW